jgi:hypothetical protein
MIESILDSSIAVMLILFVLSQINERITNLVKLKLHQSLGAGNLRNIETYDEESEKKRESKIVVISIVCGVLVSLILKADIYSILQIAIQAKNNINETEKSVTDLFTGWGPNDLNLRNIVGCLFTGVFLSFGSKWWHDILDLLLEIKNVKRKEAK